MRGATSKNEPSSETALVSGFVRSFVSGMPIVGANIRVLELDLELKWVTDGSGRFGPMELPIGQSFTLVCEKEGNWFTGYRTTQTVTFVVPPEGIHHPNYLKNISFQVPSNMAFSFCSWAMGIAENPNAGLIAVTATPPDKTLNDLPHGAHGVEVSLHPNLDIEPYYPGIYPYIYKTNFFRRELKTSHDGGAIIPNVKEGNYELKAKKGAQEYTFFVKVRKGVLTNISPPQGPVFINDI